MHARWLCLLGLIALTDAAADPKADKKDVAKVDKPAPKQEPKVDVSTLTDDPKLNKADRVEGEETRGYVAFTFDDGPNPTTTPGVIDALEKYNIPATFFIVSQRIAGKNGEKSRDVLAREVKAGFTIGSHSWSHPNLRATKNLSLEIDDAIRLLSKESGRMIGLFRAPYGALDNTSRGWLKKRNLTEVFWSVDTLDWKARDKERLRKKTINMILAQDGGVVLMHDVKPITSSIVASVLDDLEAENCKRLAAKKDPIWPVSIHYFLRDKKQHRAIPDEVKKQTDAYKAALPGRCAKRPPPPPEAVKPVGKDVAKPSKDASNSIAKPPATSDAPPKP